MFISSFMKFSCVAILLKLASPRRIIAEVILLYRVIKFNIKCVYVLSRSFAIKILIITPLVVL